MRLDYFKMGWNVFDFVIVVFSIVGKLLVYDSKLDFFYIRSFNGSFLKCTLCAKKRTSLIISCSILSLGELSFPPEED